MQRVLFRMVLALALAIASAPGLLAQETTGSIEGAVKDSGGAVLPGVTVEATGPSGTVVAVTNERGEFRFPRLPSGQYTVKAALPSFREAEATVNLTIGATRRADFTLQIAGVAETIQVTAETPRIDLTSAQTSTSISRERIEFVPRGRDFTDVV
ncbi:MAG: carboxypeptidase-like regulatory domain-containing protein, partial [Acidobacteriota bacterium]|nr:carboxypeptidase-like regulatory domain-containing protein [Acidobacteriota bacterium]